MFNRGQFERIETVIAVKKYGFVHVRRFTSGRGAYRGADSTPKLRIKVCATQGWKGKKGVAGDHVRHSLRRGDSSPPEACPPMRRLLRLYEGVRVKRTFQLLGQPWGSDVDDGKGQSSPSLQSNQGAIQKVPDWSDLTQCWLRGQQVQDCDRLTATAAGRQACCRGSGWGRTRSSATSKSKRTPQV